MKSIVAINVKILTREYLFTKQTMYNMPLIIIKQEADF